MRDRFLIFCGLFVFLAIFTCPIWHGIAASTSTAEPELHLPDGQKTCVAPISYMRSAHMQLLIDRRRGDVREHRLFYTAYDGTRYKVNLTNTCLGQCHGNKQKFCDNCHNYVAIPTPSCWDCHQDVSSRAVTTATAAVPGRMP